MSGGTEFFVRLSSFLSHVLNAVWTKPKLQSQKYFVPRTIRCTIRQKKTHPARISIRCLDTQREDCSTPETRHGLAADKTPKYSAMTRVRLRTSLRHRPQTWLPAGLPARPAAQNLSVLLCFLRAELGNRAHRIHSCDVFAEFRGSTKFLPQRSPISARTLACCALARENKLISAQRRIFPADISQTHIAGENANSETRERRQPRSRSRSERSEESERTKKIHPLRKKATRSPRVSGVVRPKTTVESVNLEAYLLWNRRRFHSAERGCVGTLSSNQQQQSSKPDRSHTYVEENALLPELPADRFQTLFTNTWSVKHVFALRLTK